MTLFPAFKKHGPWPALGAILLCQALSPVFFDMRSFAEEPAQALTSKESTEPAPAVVPAESAPGNVTVDFKDADIQNVLRILSLKSGVNIVAGKDVTGSVTVRLVDVPWEKALDVVLKTYGYAYDRQDNIIRVTTIENLKKEELLTQVYSLNYATALDVEKSLKDVLSERGKIRSDTRSNTVIVTDMPTVMQRVNTVIQRLDKQTPQVVIQAKVIETTLGDSDRLGIKWSTKVALSGSSRPTTFPFPALSDPSNTALRQFLPPGRGQVSSTNSVGTSGATTTTTVQDFPSGPVNAALFPVVDKSQFGFGTLDFTQFQAVMEAISERQNAKVLSEPHITILNNKEGKILVGEVIAIPTFERNATTGHMEITGYKDRDVGIRLTVVPQINDQNEIVVSIQPEITTLMGYDSLTPEIKAPHFSTRSATTQVRIKNGQTIAIGGLIKENEVESKTKVPLLGDVPLLGKLFNFKDKSTTKTDLLFFMTVNVVTDPWVATVPGHKV